MNSKQNKYIWFGVGLLALFVLFTVLVVTVDVKPIGRQESDVGMATINEKFNSFTGYNETLYEVTEKVGYFAFAVIAVFGVIGLMQLIKRKSLLKVDKDILVLGGFYVVVLACYVLFEKLVINYRPVIDGVDELEASYPSSHTLLFVAVMTTAVVQINHRVQKSSLKAILSAICIICALVVIGGRAFCGVHWLTDIIGGLLLAASLCALYCGIAFDGEKGK